MRWKAWPWAVGLALLAFSLVGANTLMTDEGKSAPKPAAAPVANGKGGVTVLGVVISDPPEMPIGPPGVAPLMVVDKVLVTDGQAVNAGEVLVQFDDSLLVHKPQQAKAELLAAEQDLVKAQVQKQNHADTLTGQELLINTLRADLKEAQESLAIAKATYNKILDADRDLTTGKFLTTDEKETRRRENLDLRKADNMVNNLIAKIQGEELKLSAMKRNPVDADILAAQAKIDRLKATLAEAQNALAACTIKARVAGTVEQVLATPGQTVGPGTRSPLMWIIPNGKRMIRVEVEPEFAPRIAGKEGQKVTITDGSNFSLHYEGTMRRMGTAYQTKRSQLESLAITPTKVLECLVEVTDPTPPGQPPLRVGQPVRVLFP
ncbi:MAG: HlyD family secretion protein [Fimbriiglobus sp.]